MAAGTVLAAYSSALVLGTVELSVELPHPHAAVAGIANQTFSAVDIAAVASVIVAGRRAIEGDVVVATGDHCSYSWLPMLATHVLVYSADYVLYLY